MVQGVGCPYSLQVIEEVQLLAVESFDSPEKVELLAGHLLFL